MFIQKMLEDGNYPERISVKYVDGKKKKKKRILATRLKIYISL